MILTDSYSKSKSKLRRLKFKRHYFRKLLKDIQVASDTTKMACEVVMPQVEVMEGLYHQTAWTQPLSPEMGSPVYAHSPVGSVCSPASAHSPLSHANSPIGGCCSPVAAAHSPIMASQSPMHGPPMLCVPIKQEFEDSFHTYESNCSHLTSLLKCTPPELANAAFAHGCLMGPPAPREILDGTLFMHGQYVYTWVCTPHIHVQSSMSTSGHIRSCYNGGDIYCTESRFIKRLIATCKKK